MDSAKQEQYRQLIQDVKASFPVYKDDEPHDPKELYWCEDCKEINLWSYWQCSLDAEIMLVGQDWGNPWETSCQGLMEKINSADMGPIPDYIGDSKNPTDLALKELFHSIGYDITGPHDKLFFTNFILGYRTGKISGGFQRDWAEHDSTFFPRLVNIIKPKIILCLGRDTYDSVMASLSLPIPAGISSYNSFLESSYNPQAYTLHNGHLSYVFALAHCGSYGTMNRNRGYTISDNDILRPQKHDWAKIKNYLQLSRNFESVVNLSEKLEKLPSQLSEGYCNQADLVWQGISFLMQEIMKEAGAASAIYEGNLSAENEFIKLSAECIERQLLLNLAKLFDKERICGQLNCSFPNLLTLCTTDTDHFPEGPEHPAILKLQETVSMAKQIIPQEVRNKKMAHFDLIELFSFYNTGILHSNIQNLLISMTDALNMISNALFCTDYKFPSLSYYTDFYNRQIQALKNSSPEK